MAAIALAALGCLVLAGLRFRRRAAVVAALRGILPPGFRVEPTDPPAWIPTRLFGGIRQALHCSEVEAGLGEESAWEYAHFAVDITALIHRGVVQVRVFRGFAIHLPLSRRTQERFVLRHRRPYRSPWVLLTIALLSTLVLAALGACFFLGFLGYIILFFILGTAANALVLVRWWQQRERTRRQREREARVDPDRLVLHRDAAWDLLERVEYDGGSEGGKHVGRYLDFVAAELPTHGIDPDAVSLVVADQGATLLVNGEASMLERLAHRSAGADDPRSLREDLDGLRRRVVALCRAFESELCT
ncbi:MAG TPA: hypothetical protein ENI85_07880 [Deltaproteobacteria bacterium]|nr:hypothetical protein [Deltaproteobacteria bacterium]